MLAAVGCVLGFCKQVSEQVFPAGNGGGEEGTMWVLGTALPGRAALLQGAGRWKMLKKPLSAMTVYSGDNFHS